MNFKSSTSQIMSLSAVAISAEKKTIMIEHIQEAIVKAIRH
jgi:hypothetical protein